MPPKANVTLITAATTLGLGGDTIMSNANLRPVTRGQL